ncbi:MAG TPA: GNAT family N-acetyltransferase [Acidimicrobiia bacterium]|nr:GNAT family N-acetyltransferase [Acidimicrobiia bacterium]
MTSLLRVDGSWPEPITLTSGFFRARARPWNDFCTDPMVRLDRGGAEFLRSVSDHLADQGTTSIYSPALYPNATGVWRRSGYQTHAELAVMERSLGRASDGGVHDVTTSTRPNWDSVSRLDAFAFEGFWRMSRLALEEAFDTSRTSALLETFADRALVGYAIVGNQWGISYLHRIAVHPEHSGQGRGASLLSAAGAWGRAHGARVMVLNVRDVNKRAQRLYERLGFSHTGTRLSVLRYQPSGMLD